MKDVQERLINRFVVGLGAEAELGGAATDREPEDRRGNFHRDDHLGDAPPDLRDGTLDRATVTEPLTHVAPSRVILRPKWTVRRKQGRSFARFFPQDSSARRF